MEPEQPTNSNVYIEPPKKGSRKKVVVLVISLGLVAGAIFISALRNSSSNTKEPRPQTPDTAEQSATASVTISKDGFVPATIRIKKGTTVIWTCQDDSPHQLASDPHPIHEGLAGLDSEEPLAKGDTYSFTFDTIGTFTYHDHLNPLSLLGTVVVE